MATGATFFSSDFVPPNRLKAGAGVATALILVGQIIKVNTFRLPGEAPSFFSGGFKLPNNPPEGGTGFAKYK